MQPAFITAMHARLRYHDGAAVKHHVCDVKGFDNDLFQLSVDSAEGAILIDAILKQPTQVQLFTVQLTIPKQGTLTYLDRYYHHQPLTGTAHNNDFTPVHIQFRYRDVYYTITGANRRYAHSIADRGDAFELTLYIDAAALHPQWSYRSQQRQPGALPQLQRGHRYSMSLQVLGHSTPTAVPVISRYPNGAYAAFVLTDHCDYDDTERLQTFLQGWLGRGLKMTKGVFTIPSEKPQRKHAPGLHDASYSKLIAQLYADGSEIAPHALAQSGQLSGEVFHAALAGIQQKFSPHTWIDHGTYLQYCYTTGGASHPAYKLTDTLQRQGYTSLWSYHDIATMPHQSLNIFATAPPAAARMFWKKLLQGKPSVAAHYIKSYTERTGGNVSLLKLFAAFRLLASGGWSKFRKAIKKMFAAQPHVPAPYSFSELIHCAPVLYGESSSPFYQTGQHDMLLFTSQEVVQLDEAYTPALLDKLIAEKGLHIGHTYLLNVLPYINGAFNGNKLSESWMQFVSHLSAQVHQGIIWNPVMHELVAWYKAVQQLEIVYSHNSIHITNPTTVNIAGLSFMHTDGRGNTGAGTIAAGATIEITW